MSWQRARTLPPSHSCRQHRGLWPHFFPHQLNRPPVGSRLPTAQPPTSTQPTPSPLQTGERGHGAGDDSGGMTPEPRRGQHVPVPTEEEGVPCGLPPDRGVDAVVGDALPVGGQRLRVPSLQVGFSEEPVPVPWVGRKGRREMRLQNSWCSATGRGCDACGHPSPWSWCGSTLHPSHAAHL